MLEHGAGAQVAELGLDESAQVAGSTVLDAEHGMQIIVVLDDHAGAELGRRNRHCWFTSPSLFLEILGSGAGRRGFRQTRLAAPLRLTFHFTQASGLVETAAASELSPFVGPA